HELLDPPGDGRHRRLTRRRDRRPTGPAIALQSNNDLPVKIVQTPHGATSARNSRTTFVHASASSIWGEWPDFSNTTSRESGIRLAISSLQETGVIQSVRPTVISVGAVTDGSTGLRS